MTEPHKLGRSPMATMRDVARLAGVSSKTVSRVFNQDRYVTEETRARVEQAMRELNYVPNMLARTFRTGRDEAIAVAVPDIADPFFANVAGAIEEVAQEHDLAVIIASVGYDAEHERPAVEALLHRQVAGLIATPISRDQRYLSAWTLRTPVVFVDRMPSNIVADTVVCDDAHGATLATEHLLSHGHTRLAFVGDRMDIQTTRLRLEAYTSTLQKAGLEPDPRAILIPGAHSREISAAVDAFLHGSYGPTAIFSSNARCTIGVVPVLQSRNRTDIALVGFGDFPLAECVRPAVSIIEQDPFRLGRVAADRLLQRIQAPNRRLRRKITLPVRLVTRGSGEQPPRRPRRRSDTGSSGLDTEASAYIA
jgi:LacI family transcriptional regulator